MSSRRESESAAYADGDSGPPPIAIRGEGREGKKSLSVAPWPNLRKSRVDSKEEWGSEMRIPPRFSRKRAFGDWISAIVCRFRKYDSSPLSGILDTMVLWGEVRRNQ